MAFIKSGEWAVRNSDYTIRTDLGSCVALCLWDFRHQLGGMNHYLLPGNIMDGSKNPSYGHYANPSLLYDMINNGASLHTLQAGIVGGGQLFPENDMFSIGVNNIIAAEFILEKYRIPLMFKRVGGNFSRSVELDIETGMITIKEIKLGDGIVNHYQHKFLRR